MVAEAADFVQAFADPQAALTLVQTHWNTITAAAAGGFTFVSWLNQQSAKKQAAEAEEQVRKLQFEGVRANIDAQINAWGADVIRQMAAAEQLVQSRGIFDDSDAFDAERRKLLAQLSAAADQGRLFFANVLHDVVGQDRPAAFGGYRPAIIDAILLDHERLRRMPVEASVEEWAGEATPMLNARRAFVSELQRAVDPRRRDEVFKTLAQSTRNQPRKNDYAWDSVVGLVDQFEEQHGKGAFWADRPRTRRELGLEASGEAGGRLPRLWPFGGVRSPG